MIIIKTSNGDHFINDKAVTEVAHDREKAVVDCYGSDGYNSHIENVEGVMYTNDSQPTSWQDEGSALAMAEKTLEELRDEYSKIELERNDLKERLAQLEPKADADRWWPDDVDMAPVGVLIRQIESSVWDCGYGARVGKLFDRYNINTVGDLLRIGRRDFKKYRSVGRGSISRIDDALGELYDIKGW